MNNPLETSLFDKAARFAIDAHSGTERRGKGFPYIIHPMEAASIVATVTADPEMLAAAVLHDVVEDTDATIEQIREAFGNRVALLVQHETAPKDKSLTWRQKKQRQLDQLASAGRDSKIVAIGDKLSNMRGVANDYSLIGEKLWSRFHAPGGKKDIEWYYRGLAGALFELSETLPYQEFLRLLDSTFGPMDYETAASVDLNDYEESGGGYFATSYNHRDGQTMVKFYNADVDKSIPQTELRTAYAVMRMGLPTPTPGRFVTDGKRFGAEFRRINPKESFSRYVSNRPESYEQIAHRFARMCRQLHSTPCNTTVFASEKENAIREVTNSPRFSETEKQQIIAFIKQVPDIQTCLHGDLHIGNVITTALGRDESALVHDFWIDLGDFRWGNPLFDLGMFYFTTHNNEAEITRRIFHLEPSMMSRIWDVFIRDYYGIESDEELLAIEKTIEPFAALKMIHFDTIKPMPDGLIAFVRHALGVD